MGQDESVDFVPGAEGATGAFSERVTSGVEGPMPTAAGWEVGGRSRSGRVSA